MLSKITGTFLDEITHDIPSQNWGAAEWRREFDLYSKIGIDTVIIIRAGYQNKCIFPSKTLTDRLPVYEDLGELFFSLADEYGIKVFFGTYDSGHHWMRGAWWKEVEINKAFVEEAAERYGHHQSFAGWYLCHETSRNAVNIVELFNEIGRHCKQVKDVPVLISPFPQGAKQFSGADIMSLEDSFDHWKRIFSETQGAFDICAFQDGQIHYQELPRFHEGISELGNRHGVRIWSNVETFDRDMPIKFPPADWRYLRIKLEAAAKSAEKIITFEFPHFMSPNSCYPAAHNLYARYRDYLHESAL
jgi:sugar phosphate isomerase/epimerase